MVVAEYSWEARSFGPQRRAPLVGACSFPSQHDCSVAPCHPSLHRGSACVNIGLTEGIERQ